MPISDFINRLFIILESFGLDDSFRNNPTYDHHILREIVNALYFTCNGNLNRIENMKVEDHNITLLINCTDGTKNAHKREARAFCLSVLDPTLLIIRTSSMKDDDTYYYQMERSLNELVFALDNKHINLRSIKTVISNRDDQKDIIKRSCRGNIEIKLSKFNEYGIEEYFEEKHYNDVYYGEYTNEISNADLLSLPKSLIYDNNDSLIADYSLIATRLSLDVIEVIEQIPAQKIDCEYATVLEDNKHLADIIIPPNALEKALNSEQKFIEPLTMNEIQQKLLCEPDSRIKKGLQALAPSRTKNYYSVLVNEAGYQFNKAYHSPIVQ